MSSLSDSFSSEGSDRVDSPDDGYETVKFVQGAKDTPEDAGYAEIGGPTKSTDNQSKGSGKLPVKKQRSVGALSLPRRFFPSSSHHSAKSRPASMDVSSFPQDHYSAKPVCPISLSEFVRNHSKDFPLRVTIEKGFCSSVEEASLSSGDTCDVHFMKYTKVVYITPRAEAKDMLAIPMNSAVQVGLVFCAGDDGLEQGLKGYEFNSVADLVALPILPRIVRVLKSYKGSNASSSVEENELLTINRVSKAKFVGSTHLKVFSITRREKKSLPVHCAGLFSTKPSDIRLYLPQLLNIPDMFPAKAKLFFNDIIMEDSLEDLPVGVITLTHSSIETSLVATMYSDESEEDEEEEEEEDEVLDIPVMLDVDVKIEQLYPNKKAELLERTRSLFENFDPTKAKIFRPAISSGLFAVQTLFFHAARQDHKKEGIQVETPLNAFRSAASNTVQLHYAELPLDRAAPTLPPKRFSLTPSESEQDALIAATAGQDPLSLDTDDEANTDDERERKLSTPVPPTVEDSSEQPYLIPKPRTRRAPPSTPTPEEDQKSRGSRENLAPPLPPLPPPPSTPPTSPPPPLPTSAPPSFPLPTSSFPVPQLPSRPSPPSLPTSHSSAATSPSLTSSPPSASHATKRLLSTVREGREDGQDQMTGDGLEMKPPRADARSSKHPPIPHKPSTLLDQPPPGKGVKLRPAPTESSRAKHRPVSTPPKPPRPVSTPPKPTSPTNPDPPLYDDAGYMILHSVELSPRRLSGGQFEQLLNAAHFNQAGSTDGDVPATPTSGGAAAASGKSKVKLHDPVSSIVNSIQTINARLYTLEANDRSVSDQLSDLTANVAQLAPLIEQLLCRQDSLEAEIKELRKQGSPKVREGRFHSCGDQEGAPNQATVLANRRYLSSLDTSQVSHLFDELELSHGTGRASLRQLDGSALLKYDLKDTTALMADFGISEQSDVQKLTDYISGRSSARTLLDTYRQR